MSKDQNTNKDRLAERLDRAVGNALEAAEERESQIETLFSRWRQVRRENNFRRSLETLFSGE